MRLTLQYERKMKFHWQEVESLGINYGQVANNLPPPNRVLDLLHALRLTKARIYDTNPQVLTAFANSNIEIIVTVENEMLATLTDPSQALQWVSTHIKPYFPPPTSPNRGRKRGFHRRRHHAGLIPRARHGQHPLGSSPARLGSADHGLHAEFASRSPGLVPAVSRPFSSRAEPNNAPAASILGGYESPLLDQRVPVFRVQGRPNNISLDYALFDPNPGVVDPYTNLHYDNMMYAQVDAVIFAMARMGYGGLEVRVSETGWPSQGDPNETGATVDNAAIYNGNLLRRQMRNEGTPLRPGMRLEVYLFALFNEDMKPGPTSERNYGLLQPDGTMVYNVGLSGLN
ncbi:hypothetical protein DH2020_009100 [Rehmannia glutinosa]|uniref:Glucan endo-1,3-beta-D-glucosidase n=1 Tax=Rehmannia glutinosa TaxID=99300 RepID=A0ABR0X5A9_REHGL